jgi:hypothetical protein
VGGLEATHRTVQASVCDVVRWEDGKAVEDHVYWVATNEPTPRFR